MKGSLSVTLAAASALALAACSAQRDAAPPRTAIIVQEPSMTPTSQTAHPYVGMWVTADGHIRQELTSDGRYDEARGTRKSAYTGRYTVTGNKIDYVDDTGFTADGVFVDADTLHHGGMIFYRER
ncbi:hypothetical protein E1286_21760 [Nonomuraea terrae]|uniref:Protein Atu4866 n=1 Tax=Nonomuraea terrae TaxID=2530383 RepID=A0A4R4YMB7_9ACTN|nr:Atu4866 domain-containing protein [Nonomuraea terrae]TDD46123.1 hypothetical protein E1286_21760 [Nonomuraea terrae]